MSRHVYEVKLDNGSILERNRKFLKPINNLQNKILIYKKDISSEKTTYKKTANKTNIKYFLELEDTNESTQENNNSGPSTPRNDNSQEFNTSELSTQENDHFELSINSDNYEDALESSTEQINILKDQKMVTKSGRTVKSRDRLTY